MFTINRLGAYVMLAQDKFRLLNRNCNPYKEDLEIFNKYCKKLSSGVTEIIPQSEYSEEDKKRLQELKIEKKEFDKKEKLYVLDFLLKQDIDYEDYIEYCYSNDLVEELEKITPCKIGNHQCSLFCCKYDKCKEDNNEF